MGRRNIKDIQEFAKTMGKTMRRLEASEAGRLKDDFKKCKLASPHPIIPNSTIFRNEMAQNTKEIDKALPTIMS
jgi:hypothetical protein